MMVIDLTSDDPYKKFASHERMANAILDVMRKKGHCTQDDLLALGFSKQEVAELWHMAYAMADIELKLCEQ